tara:strand:- start:153 stop:329 length:177 start_codon:yes stop_codon:yes gene_type:complete
MIDNILDTLKMMPVKELVLSGGAVGLSFVEWLPFWLRIITMVCTIVYIVAKTYKVLKD